MNKKLKLLVAMLTVTTILCATSACAGFPDIGDFLGIGDKSSSSESLSDSSVKKEKYTVRFVNEDNSIILEKKYEEGTMPEVPEAPTYTAEHYTYVFTGWDKEITAVEDDVIYKAVYTKTAIDYTVTFMADGVQVGEVLTYNLDNPTITAPEVPAKEGFGGSWEAYTLDGGNKVVNAVYKLGEYIVTFKADGVTVGTDTYTMDDKEINVPEVPAKEHYTGVWESYTLTTGDIVVNAVYTAIDYTVTFMADGVQVGEVLTYNLDNPTITAPEVPAKEHYTGVWEDYTLDGGNKVVNAVYTGIAYTITFLNEAEEVVDTVTYALDNMAINEPDVPAKKGHTGVWADYELNGGNVEVSPVYTANTYQIIYDANGGTASISSQDVVYGEDYTIEATATSSRFYQDFLGWVDSDGNFVTGGIWEIDGNVVLKAKYTDSVTFDNATSVPSYIRGSRIASFSIVDDPVKDGKALRAQTTADSTGDTALFITVAALADFFADPSVEYFAFDAMTDSTKVMAATANLYNVFYHDYRTGEDKWTRYDNGGNNQFNCLPNDAFKTYYFPRAVYQSWVDNGLENARFLLAGPDAKIFGGDSFYIDNLRGVTAAEYANSGWSFEKGNLRTNNGNQPLYYTGVTNAWELGISNVDSTTTKFTNTITSDGGRAITFKKLAGKVTLLLNHTADPDTEVAMRNAGYISYDLYVPEGSDAAAVQDNASGVYATLKQGWNTLYAKVDATDNSICAFWDSTCSTYVIDNIRLLTAEQYNTEMLSFEGKAGVLRDSTSDEKPIIYIYTPRDVLASRWTFNVYADGATLSEQRYDTEIVKDGESSFAFHKSNGYTQYSLNTGGEMYALLKNGFTFWVYADLDEEPMINGVGTSNFINGANNKFNGGAGINVTARQWTKVVVTADDINASGRFLIISGSTAGTYYFDGFEPLVADAE